MKRFYLFLFVLCSVITLHAQGEFMLKKGKLLNYTRSNNPDISAVWVECNDITADLYLNANALQLVKRDSFHRENKVIWIFEINVGNFGNWEQEVSFELTGYQSNASKILFTKGKQVQMFEIYDINKATSGYYYHRRVARDYFEKGDYERAMVELKTAENQSDAKKNELEVLIAEIDTIQGLYAAAQDSADQENYYAAARIYKNISELNENDKKANKLKNDMEEKYKVYTDKLYTEAENLRNERKYSEATKYYQKYIQFHGSDQRLAADKLNEIKRQVQNKREMPHVFYYQFDGRAPINFGYGHFKDRGAGWFMNFSMNKEVFKLLSDEWIPKNSKGEQIKTHSNVADSIKIGYLGQIDNVPEINLALVGLSIPLVSPHPEKENQYFRVGKLVVPKFPALYLNIVPLSASLAFGYDETKWYLKSEDGKEVVSEGTKDAIVDYKTKALISYAPQVGLTLKWGRLALFYTYEYRYLVNNRTMYKDAIRNSRSMFGIGFAW